MKNTLKFIASDACSTGATGKNVIAISNDADPRTVRLDGIQRIDLQFPKFTDGRAYSQAFLLRRRFGFKGELRATGDVLVDQLVQMQRSGFDSVVLRADQNLENARRQLNQFTGFYQGDELSHQPPFAHPNTETTA